MSVHRVLRGGSFSDDSRILRTASRVWREPEGRYWYGGFRMVVVRRKKP